MSNVVFKFVTEFLKSLFTMEVSRHIFRKCVLRQLSGGAYNSKYTLRSSPVTIGRSIHCAIPVSDTDVERRHCVFTSDGVEGWTVKDNISQAGTYVNGRQLKPGEIHHLKFGDIIVLGEPTNLPPSFTYEEVINIKELNATSGDGASDDKHVLDCYDSSEDEMHFSDSRKRACVYDSENPTKKTALDNLFNHPVNETAAKAERKERENYRQHQIVLLRKISSLESLRNEVVKNRKSERARDLENKIAHVIAEVESLEDLMQEKERDGREKDMKYKLACLHIENKFLELSNADLRKNVEDACNIINSLDKDLLQNKELLKNYIPKHKLITEVLEQFQENFVCSICTELFIKPTILFCSHTFCEYCIVEWRKKSRICPICRSNIKDTTRDRILENFLENTIMNVCPNQQVRHAAIISQRNQKAQPPTANQPGEATRVQEEGDLTSDSDSDFDYYYYDDDDDDDAADDADADAIADAIVTIDDDDDDVAVVSSEADDDDEDVAVTSEHEEDDDDATTGEQNNDDDDNEPNNDSTSELDGDTGERQPSFRNYRENVRAEVATNDDDEDSIQVFRVVNGNSVPVLSVSC